MVLSTAAQTRAALRCWAGADSLAIANVSAVTGLPSAVTAMGPLGRPAGDPAAVRLCRFGDGEGVALGVAEGEHGRHAGPAQDLVDVDAGG